MKPKNKKSIYLFSFTILGLLVGVMLESLIELFYINLLLSNYNQYSYNLSWSDLTHIRDLFAVLLVAACAWWGYSSGIYWWHQIYDLKMLERRKWKNYFTKKLSFALGVSIVAFGIIICFGLNSEKDNNNFDYFNSRMKITSSSFSEGGIIPEKYTCKSSDPVNPELKFSGVPKEAKSLALIMHDPDAPASGGFIHWVIYNMPSKTQMIAENSIPPGVQAINGKGTNGYVGPCPPSGTHRYFFYLYALDKMFPSNSIYTKTDLTNSMEGHILKKAELMAKSSH